MTRFGQDAYKPRFKVRIVVVIIAVILIAGAGYVFVSRMAESPPTITFSVGDTWTWAGTTQSSSNGSEVTMFSKTEQVTGEQVKRGYASWVVKSSDTISAENYSLDYIHIQEGEMYKIISESFSGGSKTGEIAYAGPALMIEFPLEVGKTWTDTKSVSGYDKSSGIELTSARWTQRNEVLRRESVTVPAGTFECWVIESYEILDGTHVITVENQLLGVRATTVSTQTGWYSERVKNFVKITRDTTSFVTILEQTVARETHTETNLSSYSVK